MEYRLIRHTITGDVVVIGSDGFVSLPLAEADYLTADAELCADWWRVDRPEYNTALWAHPLWRIVARHQGPDRSTPGSGTDGRERPPPSGRAAGVYQRFAARRVQGCTNVDAR